MDGYINVLNGFGTSRDSSEAYEYLPESAIPDISLVSHYETNGLFVLAVKEGREKDEAILKLVEVLKSSEVRQFIEEKYEGGVVPVD